VVEPSNLTKETLYDGIIYWLDNIKPMDGSKSGTVSIESYKDLANYAIKDTFLGNTIISQIKKENLDNFILYMVKEKRYSRSTIKRIMVVINLFYKYLSESKQISYNIIQSCVIPSENNVITKKKEIKFLDKDDIDKLYIEFRNSVEQEKYGINMYVIMLVMYTGMRISECLALQWKDINTAQNIINVTHSIIKVRDNDNNTKKIIDSNTTKSQSSNRSIPIAPRALEILQLLKERNERTSESDYLFLTKNDNFIDRRGVSRTLERMLKNAGCKVQHCGIHALRHSFGSYLISEGINIKIVSEILGHADISTTLNIYVHILNQQKMAAVSIFRDDKKEMAKTIIETSAQEITQILKENDINIIEIEEGMLGYINGNNIKKLPINNHIIVNNNKIENRLIYKEFYDI